MYLLPCRKCQFIMSYGFYHSAMMTDGGIKSKLAHYMNKQEYVFVCWSFSAFRPCLSCISNKSVDADEHRCGRGCGHMHMYLCMNVYVYAYAYV